MCIFTRAAADSARDVSGLTISLKKKKNSEQKDCVTCCQHNTHHFQFKNVVFVDDVEKIAYLGSTMTRNATLDDEILISLTNHM